MHRPLHHNETLRQGMRLANRQEDIVLVQDIGDSWWRCFVVSKNEYATLPETIIRGYLLIHID